MQYHEVYLLKFGRNVYNPDIPIYTAIYVETNPDKGSGVIHYQLSPNNVNTEQVKIEWYLGANQPSVCVTFIPADEEEAENKRAENGGGHDDDDDDEKDSLEAIRIHENRPSSARTCIPMMGVCFIVVLT